MRLQKDGLLEKSGKINKNKNYCEKTVLEKKDYYQKISKLQLNKTLQNFTCGT